MKDVNVAILSGRIANQPTFLETKTGKGLCRFNLASNYFIKKNNEWDKQSTFITVQCWNDLAVNAATNMKKGQEIIVYGTLKFQSYKDAKAMNRSYNYILAQKIESLQKNIKERNGVKSKDSALELEEDIISVPEK